ncbi:MAG: polyhydroxyalkanoate synthesis regulator DNA-binding domain-containing protein [candidate division WOR-3 bacterium]|nr:polyhydroxyalkanoate synthesis regulator DNA-binding domain-containing protein [candidate division WOR-3 bacterium]
MRIIKKYAARKMYDVKESRFINLSAVADMILAGEDVQVTDNRTGNDITTTVLAQIILEQQKQKQNLSSVPGLLRELIKKGTGSVFDLLEKPVFGPLGLISLTEEKARQIIGRLVKMGKVSTDEEDNLLKGLLTKTGESRRMLESFIKNAIVRMNMPTRVEFEKLNAEIDRLKEQLATIRASNKAGTT